MAAEAKQWAEHLQFGAVKVLSEEDTEAVLREVPPERILNRRFAYKDKARAQWLRDPSVPIKAKARLRPWSASAGGRRPDG